MISFEARKRHASPYRCNPLNIALPFSLIDCFRKYRGREVEFAIRKYGDSHIRWSTQGGRFRNKVSFNLISLFCFIRVCAVLQECFVWIRKP